jgi:hypothetical protein
MALLHFFYPENDLALATNDANYTAPRAAVDLRVSGEPLALWFGNQGDKFYTQGVNGEWYDAITDAFGIGVDVFDGDISGLAPMPWGWSIAVRKCFAQLGFDESALPDDAQIERMRMLSHRRTSARIAQMLVDKFGSHIGAPAVEVDNADDVLQHVHNLGRAMIKLPWSSSGRGVGDTLNLSDEEIVRRAMGTVRRQGSVLIEPYYESPQNFAYLFEMRHGQAIFAGYSLFEVDNHCAYSGSIVAGDDILEKRIATFIDIDLLHKVRDTLSDILTEIIGETYTGALGIDMMISGNTLAVAEMNLRMTMGHVAHALAERIMAPGTVGRYTIVPRTDNTCLMPTDCTIVGGKLTAGTLDLVPADRRHRITLTVAPTR